MELREERAIASRVVEDAELVEEAARPDGCVPSHYRPTRVSRGSQKAPMV